MFKNLPLSVWIVSHWLRAGTHGTKWRKLIPNGGYMRKILMMIFSSSCLVPQRNWTVVFKKATSSCRWTARSSPPRTSSPPPRPSSSAVTRSISKWNVLRRLDKYKLNQWFCVCDSRFTPSGVNQLYNQQYDVDVIMRRLARLSRYETSDIWDIPQIRVDGGQRESFRNSRLGRYSLQTVQKQG